MVHACVQTAWHGSLMQIYILHKYHQKLQANQCLHQRPRKRLLAVLQLLSAVFEPTDLTSIEQKGCDRRLSRCGALTSNPVRLWCFLRILTSPVYARMLQWTISRSSPWKLTKRLYTACNCSGVAAAAASSSSVLSWITLSSSLSKNRLQWHASLCDVVKIL